MDIDCEVYDKSESLNKRIRTAEKQRVPFVAIVGDEEIEKNSVALRDRRKKERYNLKFEDFMVELSKQLNEGKI
jgi:threonyl-tRNA synthetase